MTDTPPYTADQLEAGIANALKAHDVQAAYDMLHVLASVDVLRAGVVLDTMQLGIAIAERRAAGVSVLSQDAPKETE